MIIDCSDDPYDVSVPARALLQRIGEVRAQKPQKPIVVLVGEEHGTIPNQLLSQAAMTLAKAAGLSFSFATELPHNTSALMKQAVRDMSDKDIPTDIILHYVLAENAGKYANLNEVAFLLQNNITPCFSDTARGNMDILDLTDSLTDKFARRVAPDPINGVDLIFAADRSGMHIRNRLMRALGVRHMTMEKTDILFHRVGASHIAGSATNSCYEQSMMCLYEQAGHHVLPIMMARDGVFLLPLPDAAPTQRMMFVHGWEDMPKIRERCPGERMEVYRTVKASQGALDFFVADGADKKTHKAAVKGYFKSNLPRAPR